MEEKNLVDTADINNTKDWEGVLEDLLVINRANNGLPLHECDEGLLIDVLATFSEELQERREDRRLPAR